MARLIILFSFAFVVVNAQSESLPENFLLGFATATYQVEGAWNTSGKGEQIWDKLLHTHPEIVEDHSNGDIACDQYHKYNEDIQIMKDLGTQIHRFSLSWTRILPDGMSHNINQDGIDYYNKFIDALLANNIIPMITMYHWDLPQTLQDLGGWANPLIADFFEDYARIVFEAFGDRVSLVGIAFSADWVEPNSTNEVDIKAAETARIFQLGWFADPIFSKKGDYPKLMREVIDRNSADEGRPRSRLPNFSDEEINYIKGTADFFGLNHYTSRLAVPAEEPIGENPSWDRDQNVIYLIDPSWPVAASDWLYVVPWGIRKLLYYIKDTYDNPQVFITENGYSNRYDVDQLIDDDRISYHYNYLLNVIKAIKEDGCNVFGYTAWSLLDNFEWLKGYTERFGIISVDFDDSSRPRTYKKSALWFQEVLRSRILNPLNSTL